MNIATCDVCGKLLYEGDEAWTCYYTSNHGIALTKIGKEISELRDWSYHYCCPTPCLERAVVSYVRQLAQTPDPSTDPAPRTHLHQEPLS